MSFDNFCSPDFPTAACIDGVICNYTEEHRCVDEKAGVSGQFRLQIVSQNYLLNNGHAIPHYKLKVVLACHNGSIVSLEECVLAVPTSIKPSEVNKFGLVSPRHPAFACLNKTSADGNWTKVISAKLVVPQVHLAYALAYENK